MVMSLGLAQQGEILYLVHRYIAADDYRVEMDVLLENSFADIGSHGDAAKQLSAARFSDFVFQRRAASPESFYAEQVADGDADSHIQN